MLITPGIPRSAKSELLRGMHDEDDDYKVALYGAAARLGLITKTYTSQGEVEGAGYSAGGQSLNGYNFGEDATGGFMGWKEDAVWPNATIEVHGALIYNATKGKRALYVMAFPEPVRSVAGPWRWELSKTGGVLIRIP